MGFTVTVVVSSQYEKSINNNYTKARSVQIWETIFVPLLQISYFGSEEALKGKSFFNPHPLLYNLIRS